MQFAGNAVVVDFDAVCASTFTTSTSGLFGTLGNPLLWWTVNPCK